MPIPFSRIAFQPAFPAVWFATGGHILRIFLFPKFGALYIFFSD